MGARWHKVCEFFAALKAVAFFKLKEITIFLI